MNSKSPAKLTGRELSLTYSMPLCFRTPAHDNRQLASLPSLEYTLWCEEIGI